MEKAQVFLGCRSQVRFEEEVVEFARGHMQCEELDIWFGQSREHWDIAKIILHRENQIVEWLGDQLEYCIKFVNADRVTSIALRFGKKQPLVSNIITPMEESATLQRNAHPLVPLRATRRNRHDKDSTPHLPQ
jgi:hypothetical protein